MISNRQVEQSTDENYANDCNNLEVKGSQPKPACPDYLGPWPVGLGENCQNFESLLSTVSVHFKPSDPMEWIYVRDVTDCEWQKQRMRRAIAVCIDVAMAEAIVRVLTSRCDHMLPSPRKSAEGYLNGTEREPVLKILSENGLTEETFTLTAVSMRAAEIERMERSAVVHQACRDEAVRNLERHRANKAATLPEPSVEDAEYRVIEDKSKDKKKAA